MQNKLSERMIQQQSERKPFWLLETISAVQELERKATIADYWLDIFRENSNKALELSKEYYHKAKLWDESQHE
jgi:hypothetical protein